jgi:hypothetical protein
MSKAIASYPPEQRRAVITRRLTQNERGGGYWAARDAAQKLGIPVPAPKANTPRRAPKRNRDESPSDERRRARQADKFANKPFKQLLAR